MAIPFDLSVLTLTGKKPVKLLTNKDILINHLGKPIRLLGLQVQGLQPMYQLTLEDDRKVEVTTEQIWDVYSSKGIPGYSTLYRNKTHKSRINTLTVNTLLTEGRKDLYLQLTSPHNNALYTPIIDPWVYGVLLARGTVSDGSINVSLKTPEIAKAFASRLPKGNELKKLSQRIYQITTAVNVPQELNLQRGHKWIELLRGPGKRLVPAESEYWSLKNRWLLVQGMMDIMGSVYKKMKTVCLRELNQPLIEGLQRLIWSLGGIAKLTISLKSPANNPKAKTKVKWTVLNIRVKEPKRLFKYNADAVAALAEIKTRHNLKIKIIGVGSRPSASVKCLIMENRDPLCITDNYIGIR